MLQILYFFLLPHWHLLKINHLLDPMHIFKNVASSLWDHMIGLKDSIGIRMDLQSINMMEHVWPIEKPNGNVCLLKASWIL